MRCSQPMGLPLEAITFLEKFAIKKNLCSTCKRHDGYESVDTGNKYGMFMEFSLLRYMLIDGRTAEEYVQYCIWESGPMEWLGLKVSDGTVFEWPESTFEMDGQRNVW